MAVGIKGAPNDYDFGLHFNYATWLIGTELTLANVPWTNDYRDIVSFDSSTGLDNYINNVSENIVLQNANTQKFQTNVKVPVPINDAMKFNYLRARNPVQPGEQAGRTYYYFILDVIYRAFQTTELVLQLDVWATFGKEVTFGSCYVQRGHIGIANTNAGNNCGRDYLTIPEGLDIGGEYRTVHVETQDVTEGNYEILVCSTVDLTVDPGSVSNPILQTAPGGEFQSVPTGASFYYFKTVGDFTAYMASIATTPWVGQGIISITAVPPFSRYYPGMTETSVTVNGVKFYVAPMQGPSPATKAILNNWRENNFIGNILGQRYAGLLKFITYPYMVIELTTWNGSPVILKPESWQDAHATIREISAMVPPGQRIAVIPDRYNADFETQNGATETDTSQQWDDFGDYLDTAAMITGFPTFPLVNNGALEYLAANKNGIAFQYRSADWAQTRALAGAQAGVDIANAGILNTSAQARIGNQLSGQVLQNNLAALPGTLMAGAIGNTVGGAFMGGPAGAAAAGASAVGGAIGQSIQAGATIQNTNAQISATSGAAGANMQAQSSVRDTNFAYAAFAAKGDYAMAIAGVNAKVQDAQMIQPATSGQFGGDAFNLINGTFGYSLRWKMLNLQALRSIGDYWLRYGYAIHQFVAMPTNFKVMSKFTYWKLAETYISQGRFPEQFKQTIRGIFEKGVTVWSSPDDIGNTDWADNQPLNGISY